MRGLRKLLAVAAGVLLAWSAAAAGEGAKLDEYMTALTGAGRFSGSVLVARGGRVLLAKGYGLANAELNVPNTAETKFRLGSVTKQFTALAILQLQEKGKLRVDDSVCKYVPECPEAWRKITIHHLLTHTAGIPNFTSFPDYARTMHIRSPVAATIERFKGKPLDFAPGEKFQYSNSGYVLLGYILERTAGQEYAEYLQENIFGPVKMADSGYDTFSAVLKNRAAGYSRRAGRLVNAAYIDMTIPHAAGSLYSTVNDLYLWDQALYTDKLVSRASLDRIFAPFKGGYAYGWVVTERFKRKLITHGGGINGFVTVIDRYPEERACVIVLSNVEDSAVATAARDLAAILFGEPYRLPGARKEVKVDPGIYDAYVGRYELAPKFIITITRQGERLMMQATGQAAVEIFPESETVFFPKVVEATVTFVKDGKGEVTHLLLDQNGREYKALKLKP